MRQPARKEARIENHILRALLRSEYRHLRPMLEELTLKPGQTIYRADQRIEYVYFPGSAVVAMMDTVEGGGTVEVGIIGREGMVGINIFLGCLTTPDKAVVQIPGSAMRMKTRDLRRELRFGSSLQRLLLRYTQALLAVISQSVACSQHHTLSQRVARLILTMRDHTGSDDAVMSHKSIAALLGARRAGVTQAAIAFRVAGLLSYSRTRIRLLDQPGLKKESCECYQFIRRQFKGLLHDAPTVLSDNPRRANRDIR